MKRILEISFLLVLCGFACAQSATTSYLGQTRPQVLAKLGHPVAVMSSNNRVYEPSMRDRVLASSGMVIDVYRKKYGSTEFGIDVLYRLDTSTSRLNPVERVGNIIYTPDRKQSFQNLLSVLPPVKDLCRFGCKMALAITSGVSYNVFVYPASVSEKESVAAGKIATGFNEYLPVEKNYRPSLEVTFMGTPDDGSVPSIQLFDTLAVDTIRLDATDIDFEKKCATKFIESEYHSPQ